MARCRHGFEPKAVKCPEGCHDALPDPAPPRRTVVPKRSPDEPRQHTRRWGSGRAKTFTDAEAAAALRGAKTIQEAADRVGVTWSGFYARCRKVPALNAMLEKVRAPQYRTERAGWAHSGFKDMTGQRFGVLEVVRRAQNRGNANAAWVCRCGSCGAEEIYEGIQLRSRKTPPQWCRSCRSANPGTVNRRAG